MASLWNQTIEEAIRESLDEQQNARLFLSAGRGPRCDVDALESEFGLTRVFRGLLSPGSLVGMGAGAARTGARAIVELPTDGSIAQAVGHLSDHIATARYFSAGRLAMPLLIRACVGHESSSVDEISVSTLPGLHVVMPSNPWDAGRLARAAMHSLAPVLMLEPLSLLNREWDEEDESPAALNEAARTPLDQARIVRAGTDLSLITGGAGVSPALQAATQLATEGIEIEVIDVRSLAPLDIATIAGSVERTGRAFIGDTWGSVGGWGAELAAQIGLHCFAHLDGPVGRRCGAASIRHPNMTADGLSAALREAIVA